MRLDRGSSEPVEVRSLFRKSFMYTVLISFVVALGGFLLGFDSAVISGVVEPLRGAFELDDLLLGWSVSCLILGAMIGNACAGPLADRFGRKPVLLVTALLFTASAITSAMAQDFWFFVAARVLGGLGVGGAILIAPVYIAEIAPPEKRGRLVSFNQLNIVLGISAAFFSNYFLNERGMSWRWMLGVEAVPAIAYFLLLMAVPRSPRWLASRGRDAEALAVLERVGGRAFADSSLQEIRAHIADKKGPEKKVRFGALFESRMRLIMTIALGLAFFQQITGINAIFYYSPTIFGKAGAAADSALRQAILIGLVNVGFTLLAMYLIDRLGRKPLLLIGSGVMAAALFTNAWAFSTAEYTLDDAVLTSLEKRLPADLAQGLTPVAGKTWTDQGELVLALEESVRALGSESATAALAKEVEGIAKEALVIDGRLVLMAIMAYIAAFAISLGPVMWAMFSEIFPQALRGVAISAAGLFYSLVSFTVTFVFPWELANLGPAVTFFVYGVFAALAFLFTLILIPETKGRSLEDLESMLLKAG
ncbi:MAG: sugar porter family MFS transporter [bacterium]|nr:sugar porter family MFS transporter [bacterium]